jgi:hypothetical protein
MRTRDMRTRDMRTRVTKARLAVLAATAAAVALAAGCGSSAPAATATTSAAPPARPPLAASFADQAGAGWTIVEMGGSAAQDNNFWQMFYRQASTWRLATPAGVADNGGLVVTGTPAGPLLTGFLPSQDLTFSPLATSTNSGATWSAASPVDPGLADVPDALAAGPGGRIIALTSGGAELSQRLGASWTHLITAKALAATPAGRACGVTGLTGAAFSPAGVPMLAATCARPGVAGLFAETNGTWTAAGPALPTAFNKEDISVLRLAATGSGLVALLRAGTGTLQAGWMGSSGGAWALSPPLRTGGRRVTSTAVGPGSSIGIILNAADGLTWSGPAGSWRRLPALPRWTATLALGSSGQVDALAAHGATFTDWRLGAAGWTSGQTIHVTIPYGSSS